MHCKLLAREFTTKVDEENSCANKRKLGQKPNWKNQN